MLKIPWTANRTNIEVMEEAGLTRSFVNRIRKTASYICWSHIEKERIGTPCDHRENGGETRKRKAEGTDDGQSCCMDGHRQDSVSDLGSQGQSSLERHDRQRLRAGHLRRRRSENHLLCQGKNFVKLRRVCQTMFTAQIIIVESEKLILQEQARVHFSFF